MLTFLKRWLGWEGESGLLDFARLGSRSRNAPPAPKPPPIVVQTQTRRADQAPTPQRRAKDKEKAPLDVLDNPRLSLDKPADDGFDPYNTGAFNRSASWERIGRQRKR